VNAVDHGKGGLAKCDARRQPALPVSIDGNLGVFRVWVARTHVIPVTARAEDLMAKV
jgi:hypothetical protein